MFKAAPFSTIGITDADGNKCVRLSDLSVKGYGEDGLDLGGCWGNVWIDILEKNGAVKRDADGREMQYFWYDEDGEYEAGWYDGNENPMKDDESPLGNADEITFAQGQGICFNADVDYADCKLSSAGEVLQDKAAYEIVDDGQSIAANPLCRAITLAELTVEGYGEDGLDLGGCWGNVWIDILEKNGAVKRNADNKEMQYFWYDEDGEYEAGWYDGNENPMKDDESPLGNADEIAFAVGEGICVNADVDYVGCVMNFPVLKIK